MTGTPESITNSAPDEWFTDESFWRELYPFMFPDTAFAVAEEQVDRALALTGVQAGAVLDLCCGPGRHAIPLAKRGFTVTGVDRTSFLLEKARARAATARVAVEFLLEDMRRFRRPESFDLAVNMFTSFGYFEDKADDLEVLRHVYESLKAGGVFLLDMVSKEWLAKVFQATTSTKLPAGQLLVQRHEIVDDWTGVRNEWTVLDGDRVATFTFRHRIYSGQEIKDLLMHAGFLTPQLYGALDGRPYGIDVSRLTVVSRK